MRWFDQVNSVADAEKIVAGYCLCRHAPQRHRETADGPVCEVDGCAVECILPPPAGLVEEARDYLRGQGVKPPGRLAAIVERERRVTGKAWRVDGSFIAVTGSEDARGWVRVIAEVDRYENAEANGEFIAHARQDVTWLLSEVARLREDLEKAKVKHSRDCLEWNTGKSPWRCACDAERHNAAIDLALAERVA